MAKLPTIEKRRTAIRFAVPGTTYVAGAGAQKTYVPLSVTAGTDADGTPIMTDTFYCEWKNNYGTVAIQLEQQQVQNPARIRMVFIQEIYDTLQDKLCLIYKDGDTSKAYVLSSSPDNVLSENKMLEFNVKRTEVL